MYVHTYTRRTGVSNLFLFIAVIIKPVTPYTTVAEASQSQQCRKAISHTSRRRRRRDQGCF